MRTDRQRLRARSRQETAKDVALFIAIVATAVALGGALAHLLELPNKIGLPREAYFTVQQIYRGWNLLGLVLLVQFLAMAMAAVSSPDEPRVRWPAIAAIVALICAQVVFWTFTYPANVATENWTSIPENWEKLRAQWEYSHAVGAAFQLLAMGALAIAALARGRRSG